MLQLATGQYIAASSSTSNVSYTITGIVNGSGNISGILAQGFFYTIKTLYTAAGLAEVTLLFTNHNQTTDTVISVYVGTTRIFTGTLPSGGSASFDGSWKVYNAAGMQMLDSGFERITVSEIAPSNPSIGDLWVDIS